MENKDKELQLHFISNTHWDREWRFSARRTQYMLGYMLDMLMDIIEKYPEFKHFHLDSQTMPIQDYLEVYPEKKELFKKYISEGKIGVEGMHTAVLTHSLKQAGIEENAVVQNHTNAYNLYQLGVYGTPHSKKKRLALIRALGLPERISKNNLLKYINRNFSYEQFLKMMEDINV